MGGIGGRSFDVVGFVGIDFKGREGGNKEREEFNLIGMCL